MNVFLVERLTHGKVPEDFGQEVLCVTATLALAQASVLEFDERATEWEVLEEAIMCSKDLKYRGPVTHYEKETYLITTFSLREK